MWGGTYFEESYLSYPIGRVFEMVPYAGMGLVLRKHRWTLKNSKGKKYYLSLLSIIVAIIFFSIIKVFSEIAGFGYQGLKKLVLSSLTFELFLSFGTREEIYKYIRIFSKYTMGIYFVHRMIGTILSVFNINVYINSAIFCVLIFLLSWSLCYLISKIPYKLAKAMVT